MSTQQNTAEQDGSTPTDDIDAWLALKIRKSV
jgi:hypothetical protein